MHNLVRKTLSACVGEMSKGTQTQKLPSCNLGVQSIHRMTPINSQSILLHISIHTKHLKNKKKLEMEISKTSSVVMILLAIMLYFLRAKSQGVYCSNPYERCFQQYILCPEECPTTGAANSMNRVCYVDCSKPLCKSECRSKQKYLQLFLLRFIYMP